MATIYLIHGGWHGGWCWGLVRPPLEAEGHTVHAPTLAGLAERADLLTRETNLETHIAEVMALVTADEATDVTLVGHSYGGIVITGVADRLPGRVQRLIYLDAFVPNDGQSVFDILPTSRRDYLQWLADTGGKGWLVPSPPPESFGVTDSEVADRARGLLTAQPLASLKQKITLTGGAGDFGRTYIHCNQGALIASFAPFAARFREDPAWDVIEIATGHDAMLIEPAQVAGLIHGIVGGTR